MTIQALPRHHSNQSKPISIPKSLYIILLLVIVFAATVTAGHKQQKRYVAILDDDLEYATTTAQFITNELPDIQVKIFQTCATLTATIPRYNYVVYRLDYHLADGILGTWCIQPIQELHRSTYGREPLIIGNSAVHTDEANAVEQQFTSLGARFFNKFDGSRKFAEMLVELIGR